MHPISYRCATNEDIKELNDLRIASYSEFEKLLPEDGWAALNASLCDDNKLKEVLSNSRAFVGEIDSRIVGMAFLVCNGTPTNIYPAEWSYIRMVGVHPEFRRKGIGKRLTCMCIDYARENGEKIIGLHTSEVMSTARHIYESLGFTVHREIDRIFGVRYWLYKMDL